MRGIAISLYDKFDELGVLVDILRENFEEKYYIAVCSDHEAAASEVESLDVDEFVPGSGITYPVDGSRERELINRSSRIFESIKRACQACAASGCEYVMHLHGDAWPLDEGTIDTLIERLEDSDKKVAVRGPGFSYRAPRFVGHVMDQFFLYDTEYFNKISFFDVNPLDLMPHTSIHTVFMLRLLGCATRSRIYFYSSMCEDLYWDGQKKDETQVPHVRPAVFDPDWKLLHVAADDFPEEYGKHVQAMYLNRFDLTEGNSIESFLEQYSYPEDDLLSELATIERSLNRRLILLGYFPSKYNRYFSQKQGILNLPLREKAKRLVWNVPRLLYLLTNIALFSLPGSDQLLDDDRQYFKEALYDRHFYRDSEWPETTTEQLYRESVSSTDFPPELTDFWFARDADAETRE